MIVLFQEKRTTEERKTEKGSKERELHGGNNSDCVWTVNDQNYESRVVAVLLRVVARICDGSFARGRSVVCECHAREPGLKSISKVMSFEI